MMRTLWDDIRFSARQLRRSPGFLFTVVLTLTMAIAANVVVYGIADALLLHPLPVPHPSEVVQVQNPGFSGVSVSYPNYRDLRDRTRSFSDLAIARFSRTAISAGGPVQPVWTFLVSGNYFSMLGVQPQLGRFFTPADDVTANGSPTIVLSDECWRLRFHADPDIIGKPIAVSKHPFTIIGVAPRGFHGTERFFRPDVWLPSTTARRWTATMRLRIAARIVHGSSGGSAQV